MTFEDMLILNAEAFEAGLLALKYVIEYQFEKIYEEHKIVWIKI